MTMACELGMEAGAIAHGYRLPLYHRRIDHMTSATKIRGWDISKPKALAILAMAVVIAGFAWWVSHNAGAARAAFEQQRRNEPLGVREVGAAGWNTETSRVHRRSPADPRTT
jgi:hypothetical protein